MADNKFEKNFLVGIGSEWSSTYFKTKISISKKNSLWLVSGDNRLFDNRCHSSENSKGKKNENYFSIAINSNDFQNGNKNLT